MASIINATVTSPGGLVTIGDNTNELKIQTGETDAITVDSSQNVTFAAGVAIAGTSSTSAELKLYEDTDNGTNYVALKAPESISSNKTITFPDLTGTVLTTASAGSVLQVVQGTYSTQVSSSTNTYVDTGITASITPSSATNKILAIVTVASVAKTTGNTGASFRLLRGATAIHSFDNDAAYTNSNAYNSSGTSATTYLDSPATTSSTTYKVQFRSEQNTAVVYINDGAAVPTSVITLMEIAA